MENQNKPITFYSFIVCPYAIRTRITLEELKIPYIYQEIDLYSNVHLSEKYIKINPMHKVPALKLEKGEIIYESMICCEYLDKFNTLYPEDRIQRAGIQMWIKYYENNITTNKWKIVRYLKHGQLEKAKTTLNQLKQYLIDFSRKSGLHNKIQENGPSFYLKNKFSMFEIGIIPLLIQDIIIFQYFFNTDLLDTENKAEQEELESLKKWVEFCLKRDSIRKSTYDIQELPGLNDAPLLKELNMKKWNFEQYYTQFVLKKFFNNQKPKL